LIFELVSYIFENQDGTAKELFGPYAFMENGVAKAIDMAGLPRKYIYETWYTNIKSSWKTNTAKLKKHKRCNLPPPLKLPKLSVI
jgi:hypothetical protein